MNRVKIYMRNLKNKAVQGDQINGGFDFNYPHFRLKNFVGKFNKASLISKRRFFNEIKDIMFGYGDSRFPDKNSIILIENIIIRFISLIVIKISFASSLRLSKRPLFEDILFIIRKNPSKTKRIIYLIKMKKIIEKLVKQTKTSNQISQEIISNCKKPS